MRRSKANWREICAYGSRAMILPPCPHRDLITALAFPGQHKCNLKKLVLTEAEAEEQCWKCEEVDYGSEK